MKNRKVSARFFRQGRLKRYAPLQQLLDIIFYFFRRYAGRKPCRHFALPINQEFGEVPADIARLMLTAPCRQPQHRFFQHMPAPILRLLCLQINIKRRCGCAVDIDFVKNFECSTKLRLTDGSNFPTALRRLSAKLVARKIQYLQTLLVVTFIKLLQCRILRRQSSARRGVDNQQHLASVNTQGNLIALGIV